MQLLGRRIIRQIQDKEASVRHRIVVIGPPHIQLVNHVLHRERLRTRHHSPSLPLLKRQTRPSPHESQIELAFLVGEVLQHLPEIGDHRLFARVSASINRVLLQQLHVDVAAARHDHLQLLRREQREEMARNLRRESAI